MDRRFYSHQVEEKQQKRNREIFGNLRQVLFLWQFEKNSSIIEKLQTVSMNVAEIWIYGLCLSATQMFLPQITPSPPQTNALTAAGCEKLFLTLTCRARTRQHDPENATALCSADKILSVLKPDRTGCAITYLIQNPSIPMLPTIGPASQNRHFTSIPNFLEQHWKIKMFLDNRSLFSMMIRQRRFWRS